MKLSYLPNREAFIINNPALTVYLIIDFNLLIKLSLRICINMIEYKQSISSILTRVTQISLEGASQLGHLPLQIWQV